MILRAKDGVVCHLGRPLGSKYHLATKRWGMLLQHTVDDLWWYSCSQSVADCQTALASPEGLRFELFDNSGGD